MRKKNLNNVMKRVTSTLEVATGKLKKGVTFLDNKISEINHKLTYENHELKDFVPNIKYEHNRTYHILTCVSKNGESVFYMQGHPLKTSQLYIFDPIWVEKVGLPKSVDIWDIWCSGKLPDEMKLLKFDNIFEYNNSVVDLLIEFGYNVGKYEESLRGTFHVLEVDSNELSLTLDTDVNKAFTEKFHEENEKEK